MKRLLLGTIFAVIGMGLCASSAQALPKLTMNEAKQAVSHHAFKSGTGGYSSGGFAHGCSRLAVNRIKCAVRFPIFTESSERSCRGRVEVVERDEVRVRVLSRTCRKVKGPMTEYQRAERAAKKAMDRRASNSEYVSGMSTGVFGKGRYTFEATWATNDNQTCLQTARVRVLKKKTRVKVSEVVCVNDPDWP